MKRNSIVFLSVFVSIQFCSSVYSQPDNLIDAQYSYESVTRGLVTDMLNTVNNIDKRVKQIDNRTKKIDDTLDDIEDDVKGLLDINNVIQDKACDIQSNVDDLLECCPCDTIIKQEDIPFTISVPGVYCLGENVSLLQENQNAITIRTECVTLELKGHAIDGQDTSNTIGIFVDGLQTFTNNIIIRDGFIKNTRDEGVKVIDSFGPIMITGLKVTNCGDDGIEIRNSSGVVIDNCECSFTGSDGIEINNSKQCIVRNCLFRCNTAAGVDVKNGSSDCCLINCKSYQDDEGGFCLNNANRCNLISCVAQDNGEDGFAIDGNNNVLLECIANHNGFDKEGNRVGNFHGFYVSQGDENVILRCVSSDNAKHGFRIESRVNNTKIGSNCAIGNDKGFRDAGGPGTNFFYNNAANNNSTANFSGVTPALVEMTPIDTTGFWVNVTP